MSQSRQLERIIKIDSLIRNPERSTTDTFAQYCEVSRRTVQSDLDFMRDRLDAPLQWEKRQGWFYADEDWRLPDLPLTEGEIFALTLGAQMLQSYTDSIYYASLQSAISRLSKRLPDQIQLDLHSLATDHIHFRGGGKIALDPNIWTQLIQASRTSQSIWIRYDSPKGSSERVIDPYIIDIYRASNPYIWSFCHTRQAIRSFRIDRIRELHILDQRFKRDPDFNLNKQLRDCFQYEVGGQTVPVVIDFDAKTAPYIAERIWHTTQEIETHSDHSITLRFQASGLNDIKRWLLGYGQGAIAREPPELVALLRAETEVMARQNESGIFDS